MERKTTTRRAAVKEYTIVRGRYDGVLASPIGGIQSICGPYEILEDHLPDSRAAGARARELEAELNPTGDRTSGVHVFSTSRGKDYRPKPVRYSTYRIRAWYAYRTEPIEIDLKDVRRSPSAKKDFKDYVRRIRARDLEDSVSGRVWGRLRRAELVRDDWHKGKPAGLETIMTDGDVPRK